ncbi:MAG: SDR family oxidoreductase [Acidobacteria bacterium]|nr:SDR family oxidoreductase [Acidobacteriota bacterium]
MHLKDKVVVVTGGAQGIGRALCERFAAEEARAVVVADLDMEKAEAVAQALNGIAIKTNVGVEADIKNLVEQTLTQFGQIDLFCSNAGIGGANGGAEIANEEWQLLWEVNVMAHIFAARHVLPSMLARGEGYLLNTASAAGLLTLVTAAPYSVTKHAALAFAEWLAITHGDQGIKVSCLCPLGVQTRMLWGEDKKGDNFLVAGSLTPEAVAEGVVKGLAEERFLILPHPEVKDYFQRKAEDYDRWLRGMRRLSASVVPKHKS